MALELVPLCEIDIVLKEAITVGNGPAGDRTVAEVESAVITSDRMSGHLKGSAAADWVVFNGLIGTLDVRVTVETDDGAIVFVQYNGRMNLETGTIYVAPRFETGDERYAWLNAIQAVGKGALDGSNLHYEWYEVR